MREGPRNTQPKHTEASDNTAPPQLNRREFVERAAAAAAALAVEATLPRLASAEPAPDSKPREQAGYTDRPTEMRAASPISNEAAPLTKEYPPLYRPRNVTIAKEREKGHIMRRADENDSPLRFWLTEKDLELIEKKVGDALRFDYQERILRTLRPLADGISWFDLIHVPEGYNLLTHQPNISALKHVNAHLLIAGKGSRMPIALQGEEDFTGATDAIIHRIDNKDKELTSRALGWAAKLFIPLRSLEDEFKAASNATAYRLNPRTKGDKRMMQFCIDDDRAQALLESNRDEIMLAISSPHTGHILAIVTLDIFREETLAENNGEDGGFEMRYGLKVKDIIQPSNIPHGQQW